jgi:hypothetical protein
MNQVATSLSEVELCLLGRNRTFGIERVHPYTKVLGKELHWHHEETHKAPGKGASGQLHDRYWCPLRTSLNHCDPRRPVYIMMCCFQFRCYEVAIKLQVESWSTEVVVQ